MRIFAQQGYGPKDKLTRGLADGVITGAVLSPRYDKRERMQERIAELVALDAQVFMDPELYAARYISHANSNLGNLETWDYFQLPRRSALISGAAIPGVIQEALETQASLGLQQWIAPNVYVEAADSLETAIALNFINATKQVAVSCGDKPVFATLALSREAVMAGSGFQDIFDALTAVDLPPDGYYILMGSEDGRNTGVQQRSDINHPQVIAGWMYMNYVLSISGARVLNGCCHLLSPLLGACGAEASASGWFSGLRKFSLSRYVRETGGGRPPAIRYLSNPLLARIRQADYIAFKAELPQIANGLGHDTVYASEEPSRTVEALQSWEALSDLCSSYSSGDVDGDLNALAAHIQQAIQLWTRLQAAGFGQEVEPNIERLEAMRDAIGIFKEWAEIA
jgi:hypothetical protein